MKNEYNILEKGDIYFFYRPKLHHTMAKSKADINKFFFILHDSSNQFYRAIIIGKKQLPTADVHHVEFAFVSKVAKNPDKLTDLLEEQHYMTKTKGHRTLAAACPIAEGKYLFLKMGKTTHFAFHLEEQKDYDPLYSELKIEQDGIFLVQVKNPESPSNEGLSSEKRAAYPQFLEKKFKTRKFKPLESSEFLNYEGTELLLIGEKSKPTAPWRKGLKTVLHSFKHCGLFESISSKGPD